MKTYLLLGLAFLLLLPEARAQVPPGTGKKAAAAPAKHAVIVAVGDYPEASGWNTISSANDVPLVKAALLRQGFAEANIRVLLDAAATKAGIVAELKALATRVKVNDVVVFHYSGHGQQVADNNGDETDGLDEALVPYDAPAKYAAGRNQGEHHLRDEELGGLLGAVRQRLGPQGELLAVLDACHSGTGTRGLARARGTASPLVPPGFQEPTAAAGAPAGSFGSAEGRAETGLAPLVCYFGASPHQLNYETLDANGNGVGSLSLAFSNALTNAAAAPTYETLFDRIKAEMASTAPSQTPQVEGAVSARVFHGSTVPAPLHYKPAQWLDDRRLVMNGGALHGIHAGAEVALYPPDTELRAPGKALATGKVVASQLSSATVELNTPVAGPARQAWVVVTARTFGPLGMALRLAVADPALKTQLLTELKKQPLVTVVDSGPADLLVEQKSGGQPQLVTAQDQVVYRPAPQETDAATTCARLVEAVGDVARTRFIRGLHAQAEGLHVSLELVPVRVKQVGSLVQLDRQLDPATKRTDTGNLVYAAGDYLQLKLTNSGQKKAYFTVLDIQPDYRLTVLLPGSQPTDVPADYSLAPGKTVVLPALIQLSQPYGQEMFKVIASAEPLDLRALVATRGQDRSAAGNPFAALLSGSYRGSENSSRSAAGTPSLPTDAVSTHDTVFEIVPAAQP